MHDSIPIHIQKLLESRIGVNNRPLLKSQQNGVSLLAILICACNLGTTSIVYPIALYLMEILLDIAY